MKRNITFGLLSVLLLLLVGTPVLEAQSAKTSAPNALPPPKPYYWFELQYWQCDPLSCGSDGGPFYDGSVSTTAAGPCFNGLEVSVGATSFVANCQAPYFLTSAAASEGTSYTYFERSYTMEGLFAWSSILDDFGDQVSYFSEISWCNGVFNQSVPEVGPC